VKDATSQIRSATRRAKSDVANKLISMFLHELSRRISENWRVKVDSEEYEQLVRQLFDNRCPYCRRVLATAESVIEHLDGMNRYRVGLHVPGNVLVACRRCNSEKRRDDSLKVLSCPASVGHRFSPMMDADVPHRARPADTGRAFGRMKQNGSSDSAKAFAGFSHSVAGSRNSSRSFPPS
jgi:hypothetical protein